MGTIKRSYSIWLYASDYRMPNPVPYTRVFSGSRSACYAYRKTMEWDKRRYRVHEDWMNDYTDKLAGRK